MWFNLPMAQKVNITLVDDLTGEEIPEDGGETLLFGLDGTNYDIDLTNENAKELREALAPYVDKARKHSGKVKSKTVRRSEGPASPRLIRDWARSNGHEVPDRGRVPRTVQEAYAAAH